MLVYYSGNDGEGIELERLIKILHLSILCVIYIYNISYKTLHCILCKYYLGKLNYFMQNMYRA